MAAKVSVLICTYNYARYLPQCLSSLLNQTHAPDEIIVIDDGSQDGTPELVKRFPQVRYEYQQNTGKALAFSRAFALSTGNIICHLDADDYWEPHKLERVLSFLTSDPTLGGAVHEVSYIDPQGKSIHFPWSTKHPPQPTVLTLDESEDVGFLYPLPQARGRWFGVPNTACVRRETIEDLLPLPRSVEGSVDGIMVAGALRRRIVYLPESLAACRIHGSNAGWGNPASAQSTICMWEYLLENSNFRPHLSRKHASLLRAKILERRGYFASRTGRDIFRGAWASAQVPLVLLRNGYACNWRHFALPIICLLPVKRFRPTPPGKTHASPSPNGHSAPPGAAGE